MITFGCNATRLHNNAQHGTTDIGGDELGDNAAPAWHTLLCKTLWQRGGSAILMFSLTTIASQTRSEKESREGMTHGSSAATPRRQT